MFHTVFFDVGGTLIAGESSLKVIAREMDGSREAEIFRFLVDEFMKIYLDPAPPRFYSIKELLALTAKMAARQFDVPDVSDRAVKIYRRNHFDNDYICDDTLPTLNKLRADNVKIILISDADADVLLEQLEMFGLLRYFEATIISNMVKAYKPSDKTVAEALKHCREPKDGILLVGDTVVDMETAAKMKVKSALINRNGKFKHDADYQISDLSEIFRLQSKSKDNNN